MFFLICFRKHREEKRKEICLINFGDQNVNDLGLRHHYVNNFVFL